MSSASRMLVASLRRKRLFLLRLACATRRRKISALNPVERRFVRPPPRVGRSEKEDQTRDARENDLGRACAVQSSLARIFGALRSSLYICVCLHVCGIRTRRRKRGEKNALKLETARVGARLSGHFCSRKRGPLSVRACVVTVEQTPHDDDDTVSGTSGLEHVTDAICHPFVFIGSLSVFLFVWLANIERRTVS